MILLIALPIILKHLYTKKMNYEEPILNLINTLIDEDSINLDQIALNASFLDIAYTFLISAIRITKKNKLDNEENKVKFYNSNFRHIYY